MDDWDSFMDQFLEDYDDRIQNMNNHEVDGKIRKRTEKLCPSCEEFQLYIVSYEEERDTVIYSQEFYECLECGYKEPKRNKNNKDIDLGELYQ